MTKQEEEQIKIGRRIAELRESKNISQTELASRININRSVLNRIELGTRPARDLELKGIANVLDVSTDYLVGNTDNLNSADDDMNTVDLDKALSEEGMAMFDGQPLSEEYKKALLTMLRAEKRGE
ncbi:helix-turn-helix domain-containing protein [Pediococcus pentosaceus]|uniref:helix-turn-helix domain-containing protein n=1 Tax=Pediococcus pentosaceus TaxID=1255 RepID=UPI001EFCDBAF|nr:helix-turn-helix transcriptional regulator [Pediococcus pentosaceus]MCG9226434.1 helix-turn-helix transcriptional regulator [Pediococcus pentosaceus]MDA8037028.1 helix-turn-helix transcriptional regulator [Pediococcus pentosaceus]